MTKLRLVLGVCIVLSLGVWAASATADPNDTPLCPSAGTAVSGAHNGNFMITGNAYVPAGSSLTVNGNLTLAPGACLDAFTLADVTVHGNILVGPGAILGLGCGPGALGPPFTQGPCYGQSTNDVVDGSIIANQPLTMYLTADTIRGNVTSNGGGPGVTFNPYVNYPIKDSTIGGNLIVQGWQGTWFGALRNHVSGNVIVDNVVAADPDSNEVATNTVAGNLTCAGNSPAIQFGDSGGAPNLVSGNAIGQCGFNVIQPDEFYDGGGPQPIAVRP